MKPINTYQGQPCHRCSSTERYLSTRRCKPCNLAWVKRSNASKAGRDEHSGLPCGICEEAMDQPCSDENPATNETRGWLCHHCNLGLGHFRDSVTILSSAITYLETHD